MIDLIVIGGGASGLVLALQAARDGLDVTILEKESRVGRKLLATGSGHCNLMNRHFSMEYYHGSVRELLKGVFEACGPEDIEAFWKSIGIELYEDPRGRLYPRSYQASSVLNRLRQECARYDVNELTGLRVTAIEKAAAADGLSSGYELTARDAEGKTETFLAARVAIACGGKASPKFGSQGDVLSLLKPWQVKMAPFEPALCRLILEESFLKHLAGLRMETEVTLLSCGDGTSGQMQNESQDRVIAHRQGEVLFTANGISGPPALDVSRMAGQLLKAGETVFLSLDLVPEQSEDELSSYLAERSRFFGAQPLSVLLEGFLPMKLSDVCLERLSLSRQRECASLTETECAALAGLMKDFRLHVTALDGFAEAQVSSGGVVASELTSTLELKMLPGVYVVGEALDADADCGGYNLMQAAATALCAEREIADRRKAFAKSEETIPDKKALRKLFKQKRASLSEEERRRQEKAMLRQLFDLPALPKRLFTYVSFGDEADTKTLIRKAQKLGIRVYAPRLENGGMTFREYNVETLVNHPFGMAEPPAEAPEAVPEKGDWVILPGLAFDETLTRLGFGGGYYDAYLHSHPEGLTIGWGYECQLSSEKLPEDAWDKKPELVILGSKLLKGTT